MNLEKGQLEKARSAKSAKELILLAEADGVELTAAEASRYFAEMHREGEISDDELDNVSGGCGSNVPDKVSVDSYNPLCPSCGANLVFNRNTTGDGLVTTNCSDDAGKYDIFVCSSCGKKYRHHWDGDLWTKD